MPYMTQLCLVLLTAIVATASASTAQAQFTAGDPLTEDQISRRNLLMQIGQLRREESYKDALRVTTELLAKDEDVHGKDHIKYAQSLQLTGELHREMGQLDESEKRFMQALDVANRSKEKDLRLSVTLLRTLGFVCLEKKDYARAEKFYADALAQTSEKSDGKWSRTSSIPLYELHRHSQLLMSQLHARNGEYDKAEKVLRDSLQISAAVKGPPSLDYAETGGFIAAIAKKKGNTKLELGFSRFAARSAGSLAARAYEVHLRIDYLHRDALIRSNHKEQAATNGLETLDKAQRVHMKALRSVAETYKEVGKNDVAQNLLRLADSLEAFDPEGEAAARK